MNFSQMMFMAESEGLLPTKEGKINAVINDLRYNYHGTIEFSTFEDVLEEHGLSYNELSERDLRRINSSI